MLSDKPFLRALREASEYKRRLVVPLVGFPGLNLTGCTIKLAQQNFGEHYKVVKAIADTFKPDAVFPLMDLSVEANALGRYTLFPKEDSATVPKDIFSEKDVSAAERINIASDTRLIGYVETLKLMNIGLPNNILRGAYITGPYTLAALMMGAEEAAAATIMNPEELHKICRISANKIRQYAQMLISSGAQIICILEPSAVMLGPAQFSEFSAEYVKGITNVCAFTDASAVYHICGNSMHLIEKMCESGVDAISLDSPETGVDLPAAAERVPPDVAVIGNINPTGKILSGSVSEVEEEVLRLLKVMEPFPNFVLSTGCDLPQETPADNISAFMQAGRNYIWN